MEKDMSEKTIKTINIEEFQKAVESRLSDDDVFTLFHRVKIDGHFEIVQVSDLLLKKRPRVLALGAAKILADMLR